MLYLHSPKDLNQKTADIESVQLMRDIKTKVKFPVTKEMLDFVAAPFFISDKEWAQMNDSLDAIQPLIMEIQSIAPQPFHEPVNMKRAANMLSAIEPNLGNNIAYAIGMREDKEAMLMELAEIFNGLRMSKDQAMLVDYNTRLGRIFETILLSTEFDYNTAAIINEGQINSIKTLHESMNQGYFFHKTLEEEMKKVDFSAIKYHFPQEAMKQADIMTDKIFSIKKGVDAAYNHNMRMMEFAVILFGCVKYAMGM
jgi:hypothetical protein